ncbi:MAG: LysR family transcriptional regulator [Actinomycetaceae bacterium]|nr:LysR family transcriptional regulator [Actinomycetaceae bacterium]
MEFRQLKYFVAVAEEMHFNRASQRLHIAQPALSQQIQSLEAQLKTKLFNRTTRKVELTEAGAALLPVARSILSAVDSAVRTVEKSARGIIGTVKLGFVASAAVYVIPRIMDGMKKAWPQIDVELEEATTAEVLSGLRRNEFDIGIIRGLVGHSEQVRVERLMEERLVVALHESHPLAQHRSLSLSQLAGETLVSFRQRDVAGLFDRVEQVLNQSQVEFVRGQQATQLLTIVGLVAARLGIAVVPQSLVAVKVPGVVYCDLLDDIAYSTIAIAHRTEDSSKLLVRNCVELAHRVVSERED